jgi:hypothetical protein
MEATLSTTTVFISLRSMSDEGDGVMKVMEAR